jgi:hypothetical protein
MPPKISPNTLRKLLNYDPVTGHLTWLDRPSNHCIGNIAGSLRKDGRVLVKINDRTYGAHRICWVLFHGKWPKYEIDHINGDPSDNSIKNLRDVSRTVNQQNRKKAQTNNSSGLLGVYLRANRNNYVAQIRINGKGKYLGSFDTAAEAHQAYLKAKRKHHEGCTI